ncbi:uncharacterized protein [Cardiocondyla obscurior]|uniref:uncharacterized protein n=1 Tax=Cardiocondyla obscurior TaxID=286306 RepID=UPI0039657C1E
MADILNIRDEPVFDDRIVKIETHAYNPFANTTFEHSDEIRIPIQQQDLYTLPHESFLYVKGKLTKGKVVAGADVILGDNCIAFMFDEIRYELDGVEIDRNRNVGITSTLKNYATVSSNRSVILRNAGWLGPTINANGYFNFCVPLNMLLGFCEDFRRVVINARHELILIRARNDNNCLFPLLQLTTKHSWAIKTATQLEKPRYVVFALRTGRKNIMSEDNSRFDDCKLTNVKLYLNSECYPNDYTTSSTTTSTTANTTMYYNERNCYEVRRNDCGAKASSSEKKFNDISPKRYVTPLTLPAIPADPNGIQISRDQRER